MECGILSWRFSEEHALNATFYNCPKNRVTDSRAASSRFACVIWFQPNVRDAYARLIELEEWGQPRTFDYDDGDSFQASPKASTDSHLWFLIWLEENYSRSFQSEISKEGQKGCKEQKGCRAVFRGRCKDRPRVCLRSSPWLVVNIAHVYSEHSAE